jgi:hypothetical protein
MKQLIIFRFPIVIPAVEMSRLAETTPENLNLKPEVELSAVRGYTKVVTG